MKVDFYNSYELTGLYPHLISLIFYTTCEDIIKPRYQVNHSPTIKRKNSFSPWNRLLLVLSWVRSGATMRNLARQWGTTVMFCSREIRHIIPILLQHIKVIRLFDEEFLKMFPVALGEIEVHGALDCTTP